MVELGGYSACNDAVLSLIVDCCCQVFLGRALVGGADTAVHRGIACSLQTFKLLF